MNKTILWFTLAILAAYSMMMCAQVPQPTVPVGGALGPNGSFPLLNSGTFQMPADANYTVAYPNTSCISCKITSAVSLTTTRTVTWPAGKFTLNLVNATPGSQSLNIVIGSCSAVALPNDGLLHSVWSDGTVCYLGGGGGGITALTGDVTASGTGSVAATLATVNSGPGTCGDATHVCQVITNGKGLTTAQTAVAISGGGGGSLPFGGTGTTNSTVNSETTLAGLVSACGSNPTTLQITTVLTTSGTSSIPANCTLQFYDGGMLNLNAALVINGPIIAPPNQQIFEGTLSDLSGLSGEVSPEWFGGIGYATFSAAASGTDSSAAIAAAYAATANGNVAIRALYYRGCSLTFNKSAVGFHGVSSGYNYQTGTFSENPSMLVCPSDSTIVSITGVAYTHFHDFAVSPGNLPPSTSTNAGISVTASLQPVLQRIVSNDSPRLFYFNGSPVYADYLNGNWGFATITGYTPSYTLQCLYIDSANGNAMNSPFFTNDACAANESSYVGGAPTTYGAYIYGTSIQDLYFSNFNTAQMGYGEFIQYTGTTPRAPEDINFDATTNDGCETACIKVLNVEDTSSSSTSLAGIRFNGIYSACGCANVIDIESSTAVSLLGATTLHNTSGTVLRVESSSNINVGPGCLVSQSTASNLIVVDSTVGSTISCNYKGYTGFNPTIFAVTNSTGNFFGNMSFQGAASVGVSTDSTSALGNVWSNIAIDTANITTPYSGPLASVSPAFVQQLGLGGHFYALDYSGGSQWDIGKGGVGGIETWGFTADTAHNAIFSSSRAGNNLMKMFDGPGGGGAQTAFMDVGYRTAIGWESSGIIGGASNCALCLWSDQTLGYPAIDVGAWNSGTPGDSSGAVVAGGTILGFRAGSSPSSGSTGIEFGTTGTLPSYLLSVVGIQNAMTLNTAYNGSAWPYSVNGVAAAFRFAANGSHATFQLNLCDSGTAAASTGIDTTCVTQWSSSTSGQNWTWFNPGSANPSGRPTNAVLISGASGSPNWYVDTSGNMTVNSCTGCGGVTTGTGSANSLPKYTGASAIANSLFTDNGSIGGYNGTNFEAPTISASTAFQATALGTATGVGNFNSAPFVWTSSYWTGSASSPDTFTSQSIAGTGSNPSMTLEISHSGTDGAVDMTFLGNSIARLSGSASSGHLPTFTGSFGTIQDSAIPLSNVAYLRGNLTLTTATSDSLTLTGVSESSVCSFAPTNSTAANVGTVLGYYSLSTNVFTLNHAATVASGATYGVLCTAN